MNISQNGLNLIKEFEGCILQSYDDYDEQIIGEGGNYRGTLTIGYGHIEGVYKGQIITQDEAEEMLRCDMVRYAEQTQEVLNDTPVPFAINQNVFDALVSFAYNLGQGNLRTLLKDGTRDKQTVADMMLEYRNKGSQWEQGLLRRRQAERELFLDGNSQSINLVPVKATGKVAELQELSNVIKGTNLLVDNDFGDCTDEATSQLPLLSLGSSGALVVWVQLRLGITPDGKFGEQTKKAVEHWQSYHDLEVDGIVGYNTYKSLATA